MLGSRQSSLALNWAGEAIDAPDVVVRNRSPCIKQGTAQHQVCVHGDSTSRFALATARRSEKRFSSDAISSSSFFACHTAQCLRGCTASELHSPRELIRRDLSHQLQPVAEVSQLAAEVLVGRAHIIQ